MPPILLGFNNAVREADASHRQSRKRHYAVVSVGDLYYVTTLSRAVLDSFQSIVYTTE